MTLKADTYFTDGCGRCPLGGTPQCKVHRWARELELLRNLALECGLTEELKWGMPCYTLKQKNVVMVCAFKEYCALSFFKGALLTDPENNLYKPGENSQATRQLRFTSSDEIGGREAIIKAYLFEAIELEQAGRKISFTEKNQLQLPDEFQKKLDTIPELKQAFEALTPGRQRAYSLYFSAAKQFKTREARIDKYLLHILSGKGLNDT